MSSAMPFTAAPEGASSPLEASALELARRVRAGELTSEALVAFYLERISRLDGRYAAFVSVQAERALAEARKKDRRGRGGKLPPFHGVPIAVKDLHMLRGTRTGMGSRAFQWFYSPVDDATVRALRRAGFVIVGKTSTSELALLPIVEPDTHAPTRNPWDPQRTAGGSSGGAGAAVAAGLLPLAPGSDGAGSIRIPSAVCGLVGLKPTRGRIPNPHATFDRFGMSAVGPMARNVDDAAALMDVLLGGDPRVDGSVLARVRGPLPRLKVGLLLQPPIGDVDPHLAAAAEDAARALEAQGHEVTRLEATLGTLDEFLPIYQRLLADIPVLFERRLQPVTRWFRAEGRRCTRERAMGAFRSLSARVNAAVAGQDVVLTPTLPILPPRVGEFRDLAPAEHFRACAAMGAFTAASNLSGAPAATVPWALSAEGLPLGLQLIGRAGDDERVLQLARELEGLRPGRFGVAPECR